MNTQTEYGLTNRIDGETQTMSQVCRARPSPSRDAVVHYRMPIGRINDCSGRIVNAYKDMHAHSGYPGELQQPRCRPAEFLLDTRD